MSVGRAINTNAYLLLQGNAHDYEILSRVYLVTLAVILDGLVANMGFQPDLGRLEPLLALKLLSLGWLASFPFSGHILTVQYLSPDIATAETIDNLIVAYRTRLESAHRQVKNLFHTIPVDNLISIDPQFPPIPLMLNGWSCGGSYQW